MLPWSSGVYLGARLHYIVVLNFIDAREEDFIPEDLCASFRIYAQPEVRECRE